jgi:hypothetical protein
VTLVHLTDNELTAVFEAARTLPRHERDTFLKLLAIELEKQQELGPGIIHRVAKEIQQRLFDPPLATD